MRKTWMMALGATVALLMTGCGESADNFSAQEAAGGYVVMDTKGGDIPYPNDILFAPQPALGEVPDGTLNIPYDPSAPDAVVTKALDTLDGFSTTEPISVSVSGDIDEATIPGHVHLYQVYATEVNATSPIPIVGAIVKELQLGVDYAATYTHGKILFLPLKPLESHTHYMALLTNGILSKDGRPIKSDYITSLLLENTALFDTQGNPAVVLDSNPDTNKELLQSLAGVQQLTQQMLVVAGRDANVSRDEVVSIWSFTTQSIGKVAEAIVQNNESGAVLQLQDTNHTSKDFLLGYYARLGDAAKVAEINATMAGNAEVYAGVLANIPYYLGIPTQSDPLTPLTRSFTFTPGSDMPEETGRLTIPVLAAVPSSTSGCGAMPTNGWPVAIFQHGITRNRLDVLAISEAFAKICYAVVGIDLPLHGISDTNNTLYDKDHERTFNLDFLTQDANETILAKTPDGKPDTSGIHYMNLTSLLTVRDNIRQSTSDYVALYNSLSASAVSSDDVHFDTSKVAYVGHSLGTIAPFGYFSYQDEAGQSFNSVLLSMPGGGITDIMINSQTFGSTVINGLKEAGLEPGTDDFNTFIVAMQTALDDADPLNYAVKAEEKQKFLIHMVRNDDVIPNTVPTAPLAGGVSIVKLMGATDITSLFDPGETVKRVYTDDNDIYTFFQHGNHRSLFIPDYNLDATIEMQTEMDSFIASGGAFIDANLSRIRQ